MKRIYEIAENIICKECRKVAKKLYPNSIGCAFREIDNEYCDEVINLMKVIYKKQCNNTYTENCNICIKCKHKEDCQKGF